MSGSITGEVVTAFVVALSSQPALATFTLTDRPAKIGSLPSLRLSVERQEPWETSSSLGCSITLSLDLVSQTGSFETLHDAADAVAQALKPPPTLTSATIVAAQLSKLRFHHTPRHDLERATLGVTLLIDRGDTV